MNHLGERQPLNLQSTLARIQSEWTQLAVIVAVFIAYAALFLLFVDQLGYAIGALLFVPVVLSAWLFGIKGGLIAGLSGAVLNMLLNSLVSRSPGEFIRAGGHIGLMATITIGVAVGWLRDLSTTLRRTRDELEMRVKERTIELLRANQELQAEIAERKRAEEGIRKFTVELEERVAERTSQLEAKARVLESFAYSVSHDLKAPLRGIDGYSQLLLQDHADKLDEEGRSFLNTIRNATKQMEQLINDLLAYSRLERRSVVKEGIHLPALVDSIIAERADEIERRKVNLVLDIPYEHASAESEGLAQALRNLLDNSLKFTQAIQNPLIEIGGKESETAHILWVKDNGIGFDMQYRDRIFEIFQRLHRAEEYPGTGIGLAIVHKAMQRMGGRTWAEGAPGAGASIFLEFPKQ